MASLNVLVTGGLGHLGSRLIRELAHHQQVKMVRILDNLSTQRYCSLFDLPADIRYEFIEGDIRKKKDLVGAMKEIDVVMHLAAITDAPSTFEQETLTRSVNQIGTRKTAEAAARAGVQRFIYPSTTSVYGPTNGIAREDCSPGDYRPASPYAKYKLLGEREASKVYRKEGTAIIIRLGTVYGYSVGMRFHTAINKFVFLACTGKPLTVWRDAFDQKRPYLHIEDAIRAFILMLDADVASGEIFNILTENLTVRQVVDTIRGFVPDLKISFVDSPLLNQMSFVTDDSKIRSMGLEPQGSLEDGVAVTVKALQGILFRRARD